MSQPKWSRFDPQDMELYFTYRQYHDLVSAVGQAIQEGTISLDDAFTPEDAARIDHTMSQPKQQPEWMLAEEDLRSVQEEAIAGKGIYKHLLFQAQARKLVEWGDERCFAHTHRWPTFEMHKCPLKRRECPECMEQLRKEVMLE